MLVEQILQVIRVTPASDTGGQAVAERDDHGSGDLQRRMGRPPAERKSSKLQQ